MNKDYFKLISSAKSHIEEIKKIQENLPNNNHLYLDLNMEIRYCLSDLQSALDYFAYDLFMAYKYPKLLNQGLDPHKLERIKRSVYFPHNYKESNFNSDIKKNFQGLQQDYPEIFYTFKNIQPFNFKDKNTSWLNILNKYANESKHRNLTETSTYQKGVIRNFELQGIKINEYHFDEVGAAIKMGDVTLTRENAHQFGATFDGEISNIAVFKENGHRVVETLNWLNQSVEALLIDLDAQLENIL